MRVLSLFDGISTGQYCLKELGIDVEVYYASEIDKNAIAITQYNYPNTIQLGDVNKWQEWDIDWSKIDLLIGGSPCVNLSNAGNGMGLEGSESSLFFKYIDIMNHIKSLNPNLKFLLENVKMKSEWQKTFDDLMGVKPILIDSSLVSAQSRKRLYWTNIADNIEQPEDRHLFLKDIVEPREDKEYCKITDKMYAKKEGTLSYKKAWSAVRTLEQKSKTLTCTQTIANSGATNIKYDDGEYYKPTPLEEERLQTLPDNFTKYGIFNGEVKEMKYGPRVKAVGNGWTAEVIKHIFKNLL